MYKLENNVAWTNELKEAFKHGMTRASILYNNEEINEENNLIELTLTEERYINDYGFIGTAIARKLNITIQNTDTPINLENKELTLKIGAVYNGSTYYINYGNFIVYDAPQTDETNGKVTIVAYDYMKKFDKPYVDEVNYPTTLGTLLQNVCSQAGVTLETTDFPNKNFSVEDNQFEGNTLREVLMNIAKCAFSWARIGQDNKLYLDFNLTADNTETITIDEYKSNAFKKANEYFGPVNRVMYADSDIEGQEEKVDDAQSIQENGLKELVIYDNLFAYTPEKRQELIQAGRRLFGLRYMPVTQLDLVGFVYLDCNDIINIETLDEQTYTTRVFNHTIQYKGVISDSVTTDGASTNQDTYKNTASNIFENQRTKVMVDRANKKISLLTSQVTEHGNQISQIEITLGQIESEVSGIFDLTNTITGARQVTLPDCMSGYILELHIIGNNYAFDNLYPADDLYPYGGDAIITVTDENGVVTSYDLGITEVLRANSDVYDEYILKDGVAKIIRRVNRDGTTKTLQEIEQLGSMTINVAEGDNIVRIRDFYADISVKYIPKNTYTDQFVATLELGTKIIQNQESVKIAWNQISEAIQMMGINGNASLAIIDENGNIMSAYDKTGQHFYDANQNIFGDMGVKTITENEGTEDEKTYNYLAFSVPTQYDSYIKNGMAWGIETPDHKFYPIMFVRNFYVAPEQSGDFGGQVELDNCDIVIGATSGITNNAVRISAEPTGEMTFTSEINEPMNLLTLYPEGHYEQQYSALKMLSNIWFYKNQAGSNSFKIGGANDYCLFTDEGYITGKEMTLDGKLAVGLKDGQGATIYGDVSVQGDVYANNFISDRRQKSNIKPCHANAIEKIMKIKHKQFTKKIDNKHYDIGYIAQDMEKIDPNFVLVNEKDGDKTYYINELPIIATLSKAIQEQQAQIEELKKEIKILKGE